MPSNSPRDDPHVDMPPYDTNSRYPHGLTKKRLFNAIFLPLLILGLVLFMEPSNWLLLLIYLGIALPFVFEMPIKRAFIVSQMKHRPVFDAWLAKLEHAPEPVRRYWRSMFLYVEDIAQVHQPKFWSELNEMQRWLITDHLEKITHRAINKFAQSYRADLYDAKKSPQSDVRPDLRVDDES